MNAMICGVGGGGTTSDELTATKNDVLKGKTAVTSDSDDEAISGTLELTGNAAVGNVLTGKTFYATNAHSKLTGTMANQGAKTSTLNCGASYTIPAGYHNGSGKVTANTLASQTDANATAAQILKGKTAWVKGSKLTGTLEVQSALSFSIAARSYNTIRISWKNPSKGPWQGLIIRMNTGSYPGTSGGSQKYKGGGTNPSVASGNNYVDITGLSSQTQYYFTCINYATGLSNIGATNLTATTPKMTPTEAIKSIIDAGNAQSTWQIFYGVYNGRCYRLPATPAADGSKFTLGSSVSMSNSSSDYYWDTDSFGIFPYWGIGATNHMTEEQIAAFVGKTCKMLNTNGTVYKDFGTITASKLGGQRGNITDYWYRGGYIDFSSDYYLQASYPNNKILVFE